MGPEVLLGIAGGTLLVLVIWTALVYVAGRDSRDGEVLVLTRERDAERARVRELEQEADRAVDAAKGVQDHLARRADAGGVGDPRGRRRGVYVDDAGPDAAAAAPAGVVS